jgi:hypothetical protein
MKEYFYILQKDVRGYKSKEEECWQMACIEDARSGFKT